MLSKPVFVTQMLNIPISSTTFELATPDIFSDALAGDVYCYDLSLEIVSINPSEKGILRISIVNSYTDNVLSSSEIVDTAQDPDMNPLFFRFAPVIFTVVTDGVNPLDNGNVHMRLDLLAGLVTEIQLTVKAIWSQVNRIDL